MPGFEPESNEPFAVVRYPLLDLYDSTVKLKLKIALEINIFRTFLFLASMDPTTKHTVIMWQLHS